MIQNAEAASAQQTAAAAAAEHQAEKLDLKLADTQWELEQYQRQLKDKTIQTEHQMMVGIYAACLMHHIGNCCRNSLQYSFCMHVCSSLQRLAALLVGNMTTAPRPAGHSTTLA